VSEMPIEEQLQEAKRNLAACEEALADNIDELAEALSEIDRLTENFDYAVQALRANRIEDALHELEKALPDEFVGFAETIIKWSKKA
jgi:F0F1-type ATP synthase membrane subunit b/b'